jgi:hypothetical protein
MDNQLKLRKLLIKNPNLSIKFFASDESNLGNCQYEDKIESVGIKRLILYNNKYYDRVELAEKIYDDKWYEGCDEDELIFLIDFELAIRKFEEFICVYIS